MAKSFGAWWLCGPFKVEGCNEVHLSREDFSQQEADALAAQAAAQVRYPDLYLCRTGYMKLTSGNQQFWALFRRSQGKGVLTLPHEYPNGVRSPDGLRTPDASKLIDFNVLGHFDESGFLVGRHLH